jgi:TRAP-type transport system periplasmic protein
VLALACACTLALPARAQAVLPTLEWKLSTALGPAYPQGKGGEVWARLITERSGGRLLVKHFPGASLVQRDPAREFSALGNGSIDLAVSSASNWALQVKELNVFSLPWLFPDAAALERALAGEVGSQLWGPMQTAGVVVLASTADAPRELATKRPVHGPADLTGLRLRAPPSPLVTDTLIALGCLPASMGASEARAALGRGALDGELLAVAAFGASRLYASGAPHLLLWGMFADALLFAINRRTWDGLTEGDRELIRRAARDAAHDAAALARQQTGAPALAALASDGAIVTRLTRAGREPFREKTRGVYERWRAIIGEGIVRAAESAAAP